MPWRWLRAVPRGRSGALWPAVDNAARSARPDGASGLVPCGPCARAGTIPVWTDPNAHPTAITCSSTAGVGGPPTPTCPNRCANVWWAHSWRPAGRSVPHAAPGTGTPRRTPAGACSAPRKGWENAGPPGGRWGRTPVGAVGSAPCTGWRSTTARRDEPRARSPCSGRAPGTVCGARAVAGSLPEPGAMSGRHVCPRRAGAVLRVLTVPVAGVRASVAGC